MIKSLGGISPFQTSAPVVQTLAATPATYTNTTRYLQQVTVNGGLLVTVALLGLPALSLASYSYLLRPGDSIVVTYTGMPNVVVMNIM